ncbi:phage tail protein [Yersinia enterocolitica]|uniref:phage tail protein n=1 Tax=Yersinia enterocolitica TaxID=630 RepID=UPI00286144F9|nr:phage tail protein [Yersinia enterocolitica]HDL7945789.1 phage tail protein [Yersinia enterocolitica]HDV5960253.1 phage tail protein [Yersinia enterocolitica]HEB4793570.1 phage tail protein [Yersinia enterocolitica]HEI6705654.1 phage tail protein [Yersinia enterocolitica]
MPIYQAGSLNTTALTAPDLYVQVIAPRTRYINGVATDGLGIVGIGSWGPVNSPFLIGSANDQALYLGSPQVRKYDLSTAVSISLELGAANINAVRVTDGTDVAASTTLKDTATTPATGATLTAIYSGTRGNTIQAAITTGTAVGSFKLVINLPGQNSETFDNLTGAGAAFWTNLVNAVNRGQTSVRGASQLTVATIGTSTAVPDITQTYTLTGGTDGATTITDTVLLGTDGTSTTRKGMYALRGTNSQVINLVDVTDSTAWPTMSTFASNEGSYAITQASAGTTYAATSTSLNTAGVDDWHFKLLVGDWAYWKDTVNGINRMIAPATFEAANISSRSPHISTLNKRISNIVATQRSLASQPYSLSEIGAINTARLDVITNPCPGGNYFGMRSGLNASSVQAQRDDTYTRMTNYLALTLAASFGYVVGENQTVDLRRETKSTIESFLSNLEDQRMIGDPNSGPAFSVQIDAANNPDSRVALGYMQADIQVKYLNVVRYFLCNLEGGGSVSIAVSNAPR